MESVHLIIPWLDRPEGSDSCAPEGYSCNVSGATFHKGYVGDTDYQSVFVTSMAFGAPLFFFAFCVALYLRESSSFVFATNLAELLRG